MRTTNFFLLLILSMIFVNCSNEPVDTVNKTKLLKSFTKTTEDGKIAHVQNFEYENGFLIKDEDFSISENLGRLGITKTYQYDDSGKLTTSSTAPVQGQVKNGFYANYEYQYDSQGRLIKIVDIERTSYRELIYENNRVIINYYNSKLELVGTNEHFIDEFGRIIKTRRFGELYYETREYTYDEKGNIIKSIFKYDENSDVEYIDYYKFSNAINPFYLSFKKLNESIYHINYGVSLPLSFSHGVSPNIWGTEDYDFTFDKDNYPLTLKDENRKIWTFEYY